PPLMRDLMGPEELVKTIQRRIPEREPGKVNDAGKRNAFEIRNLRHEVALEGRLAEQVGKPLQAIGNIGGHILAHMTVFEQQHTRRCPLLRSEEHTSELQSHLNLVCRLLLEKKKTNKKK